MVFTIILTVLSTRVSGEKTNNMAREKKRGLTALAMRVNIKMERKMVMVNLYGQMVPPMKANSLIIIYMVMGHTLGLTRDSIPETGTTIKCTGTVCLRGPTGGITKASTSTIKSKAMAFSRGQTEEGTKASGSTESKTALAPTRQVKARSKKESGEKARKRNGFRIMETWRRNSLDSQIH